MPERMMIMSKQAWGIVSDQSLTYRQQVVALARLGENIEQSMQYNPLYEQAKADGCLCDLGEGNLPYRPRYIIPDYAKFMRNGSKFLDLPVPQSLDEALAYLLILYQHVPSITTFPVFLGNLDTLLEPFVIKEDYQKAKRQLKLFLLNIDRTLTDSFVHANLGPKATITGQMILELTNEMQLAVPNLTLKYDEQLTSDAFAQHAVATMLTTAKPSFANYRMYVNDWGEDFALASCYNGLKVGGGGFTLPRMKLYDISLKADGVEDFFHRVLPYYVELQLEFMDQRIRFLVEESAFFKSNFLVQEGLVSLERFDGMFGIVGLAECVNQLLGITDKHQGYGHLVKADDLGVRVLSAIEQQISQHQTPIGKYYLHAQVGIDTDNDSNSPGCRIPIHYEPAMVDQIYHATRFHKFFPTGVGDIFVFDETWSKTPGALLSIIKGALAKGMRYFSGYLSTTDVVRVTGYLVKRSEIDKLRNGKQSINDATVFGKGAADTTYALERKVHGSDN
jgi:YjjI family glycine radical enzyme